jgi:hypothetical protein
MVTESPLIAVVVAKALRTAAAKMSFQVPAESSPSIAPGDRAHAVAEVLHLVGGVDLLRLVAALGELERRAHAAQVLRAARARRGVPGDFLLVGDALVDAGGDGGERDARRLEHEERERVERQGEHREPDDAEECTTLGHATASPAGALPRAPRRAFSPATTMSPNRARTRESKRDSLQGSF